jgi:hypothetical protein
MKYDLTNIFIRSSLPVGNVELVDILALLNLAAPVGPIPLVLLLVGCEDQFSPTIEYLHFVGSYILAHTEEKLIVPV